MKQLALSLLLIVPAAAEDGLDGEKAKPVLDAAGDQRADYEARRAEYRRKETVATTLTAMNDGNPAGERVAGYLYGKKVAVDFDKAAGNSALVPGAGGSLLISLSGKLPAYPRVYAPFLAREGAKLIYAEFPASAERAYMARSLEVRSWVELGGDPAKLPVIEPLTGYKDAALAADFRLWLDHDGQTALEKIGKAAGVEILPELSARKETELAAANTAAERAAIEKELAALEAANKEFVGFLIEENGWRRRYLP